MFFYYYLHFKYTLVRNEVDMFDKYCSSALQSFFNINSSFFYLIIKIYIIKKFNFENKI